MYNKEMNFILCADLHLKESEKEYSFSVLDEILELCVKNKCEALLLAGDVFDSREDVKKVYAVFRAALEKLPSSCMVYYLPGNHEELRANPSENLNSFDFGRARLLIEKPWSFHELGSNAELLAVPFQQEYSGYRDWKVPEKKKLLRILLAHSTVTGLIYTGPQEETGSVLDEDVFSHLKIDLAAMGHIHTQILAKKGGTTVAYPGSARVWREGEQGKRCVFLGNIEGSSFRLEPLPLESAGEYRVVSIFVSPKGELKAKTPADISKADWIHLEASGVVDDEPLAAAALEQYKAELEKKCRKVSLNKDNLSVLSGVSSHPLAVRFLRAWEEKKPLYAEEEGVYEAARIQGLMAVKKILETQK
jgi:DNA repair exonuclease SbcCD nuclease subunit